MGDKGKTKQQPNAKERREKWMELMEKIIGPLHDEIKKETKQRQTSYRQILKDLVEARGKDGHYSAALKEAENYIKANRKWIALTEIDKQCRKIETDVSFHSKQTTSSEAVARVIYASEYCEGELSEGKLKQKLPEVKNKLSEFCDGQFELTAKKGAEAMTDKIKKKLKNREVTPEKIVKKVAEVNGIKLPS